MFFDVGEHDVKKLLLPKLYAEFGGEKGPAEMPPYPERSLPILKRAGLI